MWQQSAYRGEKKLPAHSQTREWKQRIGTLALASFFLVPWAARAQTPQGQPANPASDVTATPSNQPAAPSGSQTPAENVRVVRLSDVEGMVQIRRDNQTQFSQAVMNMPLLQGSRIDTGADGRAEIEFENGSVVRLTPNSSLVLSRLDTSEDGDLNTTVQQPGGLVYYELHSDPRVAFHVDAQGHLVTPTADSTFRINLQNSTPQLAVLVGSVRVSGAENAESAQAHQGQTVQLVSSSPNVTVADGILPNGFDDWNQQRDQEAAQEASRRTNAREQQGGGSVMEGDIGWNDLDSYGEWYPMPGYGMVWQPYGVGADFDPYGDGVWADYGGFGYTWISGYPWGWLPYRCGAWSYIGGFGWGWMPGAYGCGMYGAGFGYGRGFWWNHRYPRTNIYSAPTNYHPPLAPRPGPGGHAPRMVAVGHGAWTGSRAGVLAQGRTASRSVSVNGQKIQPLHATAAGLSMPAHNAALSRGAFMNNGRSQATRESFARGTLSPRPGGSLASLHGGPGATRPQSFHSMGMGTFGSSAGAAPRTSFGPQGGFHSSYAGFRGAGGGFRSTSGGFHGGSMGHAGGMAGGGFAGGGGHGGGFSSGGGHSGR